MSIAAKDRSSDLDGSQPLRRTPHGAVLLDRPATSADLDRPPPTWRGEIIQGML